jgi:hypothetical protein
MVGSNVPGLFPTHFQQAQENAPQERHEKYAGDADEAPGPPRPIAKDREIAGQHDGNGYGEEAGKAEPVTQQNIEHYIIS